MSNNKFSFICTTHLPACQIKAMASKEFFLSRSEYIRAAVQWGLFHLRDLDFDYNPYPGEKMHVTTINLMHWQNTLLKNLNEIIGYNRSHIVRIMIMNFMKHLTTTIPNLYSYYHQLREEIWEEREKAQNIYASTEFLAQESPLMPGQDEDTIAALKMWEQMKSASKLKYMQK